ncbi:hypothetical protein KI387_017947, partial [Taxus chinensis]
FKYSAPHSVDEVNKAGYDACSSANAVTSSTDGNTVMNLTRAGKRYFICGSPGHCQSGMKLEINTVAALATAPAPAPAPAKASLSPAPAVATIPASATPVSGPSTNSTPVPSSNRTPVPSIKRTPASSATPAASPPAQNGAAGNGFSGVINFVALAGASIVAFLM